MSSLQGILFKSLHPCLVHKLGSGECRMYPVAGPVRSRGPFNSLIIHLLEWDEYGFELVGYLTGSFLVFIEFRIPSVINCFDTGNSKWLADYHLHLRQCLQGPLNESNIIPAVNLTCTVILSVKLVPDIIHADENAQHIRFYLETVLVPPFRKLEYLVSGDTLVVDFKVKGFIFVKHGGSCKHGIT